MELFLVRVIEDGAAAKGVEQWIRFPNTIGLEMGLGRSCDAAVRLMSAHISRNHALMCRNESGSFSIKDTRSLNGIHINNVRTTPNVWHELKSGDKVEIGKPDDEALLEKMDLSERLVYIVKSAPTAELNLKQRGPKQHFSSSMKRSLEQKASRSKLLTENKEGSKDFQGNTSSKMSHQKGQSAVCSLKRPFPTSKGEQDSSKETIKKVFPEKIPSEHERLCVPEELTKKASLVETDGMIQENKRLKLELEMKQKELWEEREQRDRKLKEEQTKLAAEFEKNYKTQLEKKEEELEMRLQLEKDIALEQYMVAINGEEKPNRAMETVVNAMENELQCSICSELFIASTTLSCAHTFCEYCIQEWKKVKRECPVCRHPISTMTKSLVLDNYIDKVMQSLSEEMKQHRTKMVSERQKIATAQTESLNQGRGRGRGRNTRARGRGRRRGRGRGSNVQTRSTVVVISDIESSDSSSSDDSDSLVADMMVASHRVMYPGAMSDSDSSNSLSDYNEVMFL